MELNFCCIMETSINQVLFSVVTASWFVCWQWKFCLNISAAATQSVFVYFIIYSWWIKSSLCSKPNFCITSWLNPTCFDDCWAGKFSKV